MSGDHRATTGYKKELLIETGFKQYRNTTLFKKNGVSVISPAIAENQQGKYWFDIREAIVSEYLSSENKSVYLLLRIIPDIFIFQKFDDLIDIMGRHSKREKTGNRVWSFEVVNRFSEILNKAETIKKVRALKKSESEVNELLQGL